MEAQFDSCVRDRCLILSRVQLLWSAMLTLSSTPLSAGSCTFGATTTAGGAMGAPGVGTAAGGANSSGGAANGASASSSRESMLRPTLQQQRRDAVVLNWEFLMNRLDSLYLETQFYLQARGELAYAQGMHFLYLCFFFLFLRMYICTLHFQVFEVYVLYLFPIEG